MGHTLATPLGRMVIEDPHQSLHFLREGNIDGALYLAGARGHPLSVLIMIKSISISWSADHHRRARSQLRATRGRDDRL